MTAPVMTATAAVHMRQAAPIQAATDRAAPIQTLIMMRILNPLIMRSRDSTWDNKGENDVCSDM